MSGPGRNEKFDNNIYLGTLTFSETDFLIL